MCGFVRDSGFKPFKLPPKNDADKNVRKPQKSLRIIHIVSGSLFILCCQILFQLLYYQCLVEVIYPIFFYQTLIPDFLIE